MAWSLTEAAKVGYTPVAWPRQYYQAKRQLEAGVEREKAAIEQSARARVQHAVAEAERAAASAVGPFPRRSAPQCEARRVAQ